MKICFIVSCIYSKSKGNGGHYHSLSTMYKALSVENEVFIINVGTSEINSLDKNNFNLYNVISTGVNFFSNLHKIEQIIKEEKPDIINSFDHFAHFWTRVVGNKFKIPYTQTKCGGENQKYFPYSKYLILYSTENFDYLKDKSKFKETIFYHIPNRVFKFESSLERINDLRNSYSEVNSNEVKFLRICRIGRMFKKSIIQLVELIDRLNKDGANCMLFVIGIVEDQSILEELKAISINKKVVFINDERFIKNAKELIGFSDFVMGTGRSFMEAASQGKVMLAPISQGNIPIIVNAENINSIMDYNFSQRLILNGYNEESNYSEIFKVVSDNHLMKDYKDFSLKIFNEKFNIETVVETYIEIYKKAKVQKEKYFDLIIHFFFLLKKYKFKI